MRNFENLIALCKELYNDLPATEVIGHSGWGGWRRVMVKIHLPNGDWFIGSGSNIGEAKHDGAIEAMTALQKIKEELHLNDDYAYNEKFIK